MRDTTFYFVVRSVSVILLRATMSEVEAQLTEAHFAPPRPSRLLKNGAQGSSSGKL
jgi:hypothetical protein